MPLLSDSPVRLLNLNSNGLKFVLPSAAVNVTSRCLLSGNRSRVLLMDLPSTLDVRNPAPGLSPSRPGGLASSCGGGWQRRDRVKAESKWPSSFGIGTCCKVSLRSSRQGLVACRALDPMSKEILKPPVPGCISDEPQVWYFAVGNAQSLMLEGAPLEAVLQDGIERAERAKRPRDVWLIMEPAFLSEHPGLNALNLRLVKPTAAILSTNGDWMLSHVKQSLPQAVIGKFLSPSTAVPDPLKSNLNPQGAVVGGGGVWH